MAKKEPLYPHVPKSKRIQPSEGNIFVFVPTQQYTGGALLIFARDLEEAYLKVRAKPGFLSYAFMYRGTLDDIAKNVRAKGEVDWVYGE